MIENITEELKDAILKGYPEKYIKSSMIIFDRISFQEVDNGGVEIRIYNGNTPLVTYYQSKYTPEDIVSLCLNKGMMKIELN